MININKFAKLDSFRWETKLDNIKIISLEFNTKLYLVDAESGEVVNYDFKQSAYKVELNGIKTHYILRNRFDLQSGISEVYLQILINSKLLNEKYFDGITNETIKYIYDAIVQQSVIELSYEVFINGKITDIDICKDFYKDSNMFDQMMKSAHEYILKNFNIESKRFKREFNKGLQISTREAQNAIKHPFIKWYSKGLELKSNSKEFYLEYIKEQFEVDFFKYYETLMDYRRIEITIKNKKHLQKFKDINNTLLDVLNLDFEKIILQVLKVYFDSQKKIIFKGVIEGKDKIIHLLLTQMLNDGRNINDIIDYIGNNYENRTKKKRARDLVIKIHALGQNEIKKYNAKMEELIEHLAGV